MVALLLMSTHTFFDAFKTYRDAQNVTYTVSDIVSRYTEIDDSLLVDLNDIFDAVLGESDGNSFLRVTSVTEYFGEIRIDWSASTKGATTYTTVADLPIEDIPVLSSGETLIIVESSYRFNPSFTPPGIIAKDYVSRSIITPRFAGKLDFVPAT